MNDPVKLSVSVVAYNNPEEILACLESLQRYTRAYPAAIYLSDNSTARPVAGAVREAFPGVIVLDNGANLGFGAGHNKVLPLLDSDFHAIVNPDITLKDDALAKMVDYMRAHPEVGLMMPDILNPDGSRQILPKRDPRWIYMFGGKIFPALRRRYCRAGEAFDGPTEIEFCSGCFSLIRTELFRELGGYDERYFLYMEDADLSREVRKSRKVLFFPDAKVYHAWHQDTVHHLSALKLHLSSARKYFRKWRKQ